MGRPKKEKPNHATGMYEVKVTVGHTFDSKLVRKSFYSSVSKAEEYKINRAVAEQTGDIFVKKNITFSKCADKWLELVKPSLSIVLTTDTKLQSDCTSNLSLKEL